MERPEDKTDLRGFIYSDPLQSQLPGSGDKGYFPALVGGEHPSHRNLYDLLRTGTGKGEPENPSTAPVSRCFHLQTMNTSIP